MLTAKGGARAGDVLVLTKPLGAGVITTAHKQDKAAEAHVTAAIESMSRLNRGAARVGRAAGARGATDITGYGLLGHALEMANAAGVRFHFDWPRLPFLPGALDYGQAWIFPGGASTNRAAAEAHVQFDPALAEWHRMMIYDPETSGGLLLALPPERVSGLLAALAAQGAPGWFVGEVRQGRGIEVGLRP